MINEITAGDPEKAIQRLKILQDFPVLELTDSVENLAGQFLTKSNLPGKACYDALHIALATVYGLNYLLTWNCKHIANQQIQKKLAQICQENGYELPHICTPYDFTGE